MSLFDYNTEHHATPHPLIVAERWNFDLSYVDTDGNPDNYLYHVQQWIDGITMGIAERYVWTRIKSVIQKWLEQTTVATAQQYRLEKVPFKSSNGRTYKVHFASARYCYRVAQEIPSTISNERLDGIKDYLSASGVLVDDIRRNPEKYQEALKIAAWRKQGHSDEWITERLHGQEKRIEITATWQQRGAQGRDYAVLTNTVNQVALGQSATEMARALQVKSGQLRNHLDEAELGVIRVTESAASTLHHINNSHGLDELSQDIEATDEIAEAARRVFSLKRRSK